MYGVTAELEEAQFVGHFDIGFHRVFVRATYARGTLCRHYAARSLF
jgi:hypothetical protein